MFTVNFRTMLGIRIRIIKFQNISCLRLISSFTSITIPKFPFQNISCLRLMKMKNAKKNIIKAISKHFMFTVNYLKFSIDIIYKVISKHFMFTVNEAIGALNPRFSKFQNSSCLRLILYFN